MTRRSRLPSPPSPEPLETDAPRTGRGVLRAPAAKQLWEVVPHGNTRPTELKNYILFLAMAFVVRTFSKGRIDRAGKELIILPQEDPQLEETLNVINNWRSCHSYPLQIIKMTLLNRAKQIDRKALIAQRMKRTPSISVKLKDNEHMKLSQMQDIGGCRAVMQSVADVDKLVAVYERSKSKNPHDRPVWIGTDDYISTPKHDGYRSVHLIYKYQSKSPSKTAFNGQRIEVQIRSRVQHAWATAVEISQTFTGQALKSKVKSASEAWLRFFALMGSAIALREKRPTVPGTPQTRKELVEELKFLSDQENILELISGWGQAMQRVQSASDHAETFLLLLDPTNRELKVIPTRKTSRHWRSKSICSLKKPRQATPECR
jgi:ppGpp synthetase/RelA/SpoT-type nucleotidyltranferase